MKFISQQTAQKLRGGYYTPEKLSDFIVRWISYNNPNSILEPSCGDGAFISSLTRVGVKVSEFLGLEIEFDEAEKARSRLIQSGHVSGHILNEDFLGWALSSFSRKARFDAIIGNPPFIRYQFLPKIFQDRSEKIFSTLSVPFTKHTNAWVPFVLASIKLLKPGGRLGMILPAELVHVAHSQGLRTYLGETCSRILVIDPEDIWFEDTLQGAIILLAEKKRESGDIGQGVGFHRVSGYEFLSESPENIFRSVSTINGRTVEGKWTKALLPSSTLRTYESSLSLESVRKFSDIADVDVGIVTGANKFFLIPEHTVADNGLQEYVYPMFGRSEHCPGLIYNEEQHNINVDLGLPTNFVYIQASLDELPASVVRYIKSGEVEELHMRYKCRIRQPWYKVPSVYTAPVGMLKRCHNFPRLILNELGAYTTDTAYRIRPKGVDATSLVCSFFNPLTALSSELEGRHYGGGVLELVPSEIERLLVPVSHFSAAELEKLDRDFRNSAKNNVGYFLEVGSDILRRSGMAQHEAQDIADAWWALNRRRQRKG
ncbi:N-6 DNA methylase [Mangrovitalea sediminis]|uniref:N-6 DNA methylase n=1 Tax=Mangrovitalea sediminis TaxID=1982043 RepID=UPI000BE56EDD|nr:N-6 DNA methylase [Mangrovitalea sediminis]